MKENQIHCIDVVDGIEKIKSNSIDLIIADPPFNKDKNYGKDYNDKKEIEEYYNFCEQWIKQGFRVLKDTGSFWIFINSEHLGKLQTLGQKYGLWQNTIVWHYTNPAPGTKRLPKTWAGWLFFSKTNEFYFNSDCEAVNSYSKHGSEVDKTRLTDVWNDISKLTGGYLAQAEVVLKPNSKNRVFVYQLPEKLIERIIRLCSKTNDLILDIFSHSATTSALSIRSRRNFIAIEQNEYFIKNAKQRLEREKRIQKMAFKL